MAASFTPLNGEEKKLLIQRYSDLEFLDNVDNFRCISCRRVAIKYCNTECAHIVCKFCKVLECFYSRRHYCPQCHKYIMDFVKPRSDFEMLMLALKAKCPNTKYGCSLSTNLSQLPEHIRICQFTRETSQAVLLRERELMHKLNKNKNEIELFLNKKSNIAELLDSFLFGSAEEKSAFEVLCYKWSINNFNQLLKKEEEYECFSDTFPIYGYDVKARLKMTIGFEDSADLNFFFENENRRGERVDIKKIPIVIFIVKDLNGEKKDIVRYSKCSFKAPPTYNQYHFWSYEYSKSQFEKLVSKNDETLEVLVLVEPPSIIENMPSGGTITETIDHYAEKLQLQKEGLIWGYWGPPFLTHPGGYRVIIDLSLNAHIDFNKSGLGAYVDFLAGEFDSQLVNEFNHEICITLINPKDATKNVTFKRHSKYVGWGELIYPNDKVLESGDFIVNDSLTYQVTIMPIN